MILKNLCLIFVIGVICADLTAAYKCDFDKNGYYYTCLINADSILASEQHAKDLTDHSVNDVKFDGTLNEVTHLTQAELDVCKRFDEIEIIEIYGDIQSIDVDSLHNCKTINNHDIIIRNSQIKELPEGLFSMHLKVKEMNLLGNKLTTLPANIFQHLINLSELDLSSNKISSLPPNIFESNNALGVIRLSDNNIADLPKNMFKNQLKLWGLDLSNNRLTVIHSDSFATYESASLTLGLEGNQIGSFDQRIFDNKVVAEILMDKNSCGTKTGLISGEVMKNSLKKCFDNYQPR